MANKEFLCGSRFTMADMMLYCWLDFGAKVGQPLDPANANIVAWMARVAKLGCLFFFMRCLNSAFEYLFGQIPFRRIRNNRHHPFSRSQPLRGLQQPAVNRRRGGVGSGGGASWSRVARVVPRHDADSHQHRQNQTRQV